VQAGAQAPHSPPATLLPRPRVPPRAATRRRLPVPQQPVQQPQRGRNHAARKTDEPRIDAHRQQQQAAEGAEQPEPEAHQLPAAAAHREERVEDSVRRQPHLARRVVRRAWGQRGPGDGGGGGRGGGGGGGGVKRVAWGCKG
jgi:hypothetical protein